MFSKFLSRNIAYFFRPAGFLLAFAGIGIDGTIDIDFNFDSTVEDYYFENRFSNNFLAEVYEKKKCNCEAFSSLRSLVETAPNTGQEEDLDSLSASADLTVDFEA